MKSELATFVQAFPHATVWETDVWYREGYDMVMLGQEGATRIDVDAIEERIARAEDLRESLAEVDLASAVQLMGTYAGQGPELEPWLRDGEINRDRSLRLQYLAGLSLDVFEQEKIYFTMMLYRTYPENLFVASSTTEAMLRQAH